MTANTRSYTLANKHPNIEMGSVFKKICHQQKWKPSWIQFETFEDVCFAWIFTSPLIFTVPTPSLALWRELCSSLKCLVLKHWRSLMFNEKKSDGTEAILYIIYIYIWIYLFFCFVGAHFTILVPCHGMVPRKRSKGVIPVVMLVAWILLSILTSTNW